MSELQTTNPPFQQNLPLISWLILRGRCANCGARISFRYFAVELLTALLFLAIWQNFPWPIALAYWLFIALIIVGTFVDLEHFIIPDQITIGGTVAGILAVLAVPALMDTDSRIVALTRSVLAAALGYVVLWIVLEAGKIAFGKKRIRLDAPTPFTWKRRAKMPSLSLGPNQSLWSEYFARETDAALPECDERRRSTSHAFADATLNFTTIASHSKARRSYSTT